MKRQRPLRTRHHAPVAAAVSLLALHSATLATLACCCTLDGPSLLHHAVAPKPGHPNGRD